MIDTFHRAILFGGVFSLAVIVCAVSFSVTAYAWRKFRSKIPWGRACVLLALASVCCWAAQKRIPITYPKTDSNVSYLSDHSNQSGVIYTNGEIRVHLDFSKFALVPATSDFFVSVRPKDSTNDTDWIDIQQFTLTDVQPIDGWYTLDFVYPENDLLNEVSYTNLTWICYTTWVQPPSVVTNGVYHQDLIRNGDRYIPIRSGVYEDGEKLAPPQFEMLNKSKTLSLEEEGDEQ